MKKSLYLTFDIEPFWTNIPTRYDRSAWDFLTDDSRYWTEYIVDCCLKNHFNATFFIVGEWARRNSEIVRHISRYEQFEIGCHSYWHEDMSTKSQSEFLSDVIKGKELLESITRRPIVRFRAPSFSLTHEQLDLLKIAGYKLDSSITQASRFYGSSDAILGTPEGLTEVPFIGCNFLGKEYTVLGGGYLRMIPENFLRYLLNYELGNMVYLHPHDFPNTIHSFKNLNFSENLRKRIRFGNTIEKLKIINQKYYFKSL